MIYVSDLLKSKGTEVWSVSPDSSVYEALQLMGEKDGGFTGASRRGVGGHLL